MVVHYDDDDEDDDITYPDRFFRGVRIYEPAIIGQRYTIYKNGVTPASIQSVVAINSDDFTCVLNEDSSARAEPGENDTVNCLIKTRGTATTANF